MGHNQSTAEAEGNIDDSFMEPATSGEQTENAVTEELEDATNNTSLNCDNTTEISANAPDAARSSEDYYKQKFEKLSQDFQDLENIFFKNRADQELLTNELAQKLENEERKLKDETELRQKSERELLQMRIYKEKCETSEWKIKRLEDELKEAERKLQEEVKSQIEQQFRQLRYSSECSDVLSNSDESQMQTDPPQGLRSTPFQQDFQIQGQEPQTASMLTAVPPQVSSSGPKSDDFRGFSPMDISTFEPKRTKK